MRAEHKNFMPLWGPYSKKYMGISRIMPESEIPGARFDLVVYPTYANSAVPVPNVTVPSDYHPWDCDPQGNYFRYRYELLWKDQLFADVDFYKIEDETWGIRVCYENNTEKIQNCLLNFFAAMEYPMKREWKVRLPKKADYWKALDYEEFTFAKKHPWEHLNPDASKKGEVPAPEFINGKGLGESFYHLLAPHFGLKWFGSAAGDKVAWKINLKHQYQDAILTIRYMTTKTKEAVVFSSNYGNVVFLPSKTPQTVKIHLGKVEAETLDFLMSAKGTEANGVIFDFLCLTERGNENEIEVYQEKHNTIPQIQYVDNQIVYQYHYGEKPIYFTILNKRVRSRKLYSGCLEDALITRLTNSDETYDNLSRSFSGAFSEKHSDDGFYHTNVVEAIFMPQKTKHIEYAYIGTTKQKYTEKELEKIWENRVDKAKQTGINPEGETYDFSAKLLKAALFSNVVYPIARGEESIVHYTPGKRWDSLYTWDSGFIGLGMLEYSKAKAEYIMDVYLSEEENKDFAFVSHGSLIPTQFYLFYELMQRSSFEKREDLKKYYPMLRRCYLYIAGKAEESTTARLKSGLLTVYDYFYNASGMDDYPAQVALHGEHLEGRIAPVCSNAHFIRFAKIMKQIASVFGYQEDCLEYQSDAERVSEALLNSAWDEKSGYFGYVVHFDDSEKTEIFRTKEGENYNKGIDGVTPLISGIGENDQVERMLKHLKDEKELWSPIGLSTVDMSASYYYDNGYWNGSVWFPYQYLLWKSMLDYGENEFAYQIADRALSSWKQEVEFSYNTFEMIQIETGRGGWFHQFGGLSAPIVIWYHAYYKQKTITSGFDTWIESSEFAEDATRAKIVYRTADSKKHSMIVVMNSNYNYEVWMNGTAVDYKEHVKGALEINLSKQQGEIEIRCN